jgi:transcriptional regulator with XRE-family HTH domain
MKRRDMEFSFDRSLLKKLREDKNMTVREFATACKVGYVQISRYEKGASIPSPEIIKRLTDNLGLPTGYFSPGPESLDLITQRKAMLDDFSAMKKANLNGDQIRAIRSVIKLVRAAQQAKTALS